jgi:hypothetical protein
VTRFDFQYVLSRRKRFANELLPWVPALAASLGFTTGIIVLAVDVSPWFLLLLFLPPLVFRGLFAVFFDLAFHSGQLVQVSVDDSTLEVKTKRKQKSLPLSGIIQVFRRGNVWTVLHLDKSILIIPSDVVTDEQIDYLKSFARIAAAERKAAAARSGC